MRRRCAEDALGCASWGPDQGKLNQHNPEDALGLHLVLGELYLHRVRIDFQKIPGQNLGSAKKVCIFVIKH